MTAIWLEGDGGSWSRQDATPYANEQALHDMVMQTPELLPLSGSPRLTVVGREVALRGSGYADVLALEPDGRPVVIEVKLRNNAESRRAVVAQALSYAASLFGLSPQEFEQMVASRHLGGQSQGQSLFDRVQENLQDESLTPADFGASLEAHLTAGSFRVAIVLDEAPPELVNLVGYLESVTTGLSLDLIAVHSYAIGERRIAVPQRLDPEHRQELSLPRLPARPAVTGHLEHGVGPFRDRIAEAPVQHQTALTAMADWAEHLAQHGGVSADTYFGTRGALVLLPRLRDENVGLVSMWMNADGSPMISFWRGVFERRAPAFLGPVEGLIAPKTVGKGTTTRQVTPQLLDLLRQAYGSALGHQSEG